MIIIFNSQATKENVQELIADIHAKGLKTHLSEGDHTTLVGIIGDTTRLDIDNIKSASYIADVKRVSEPYKKANRKMHPDDSYIKVTDKVTFGEGIFNVIAGPCSVETEEQIIEVAQDVKKSGATLLRGGAFKPRTSPYSFQGLAGEGLKLLLEAKKATGLPIVTEIMNLVHLDMFQDVDVIQVGAR
ncbi:MAG: 3-deoxy-7-phosphoheptulonate synthase, partial [Ruminococcus sp.]|nr:3-deoxy-7-phosphoheptulonate synthase [Ruminococcus sp.]